MAKFAVKSRQQMPSPQRSSNLQKPYVSLIRPLISPFWLEVVAAAGDGTVVAATFHDTPIPVKSAPPPSDAIAALGDWLDRWLVHAATSPWPRVQAQGTPFQQRLWQRLTAIPYGTTCTYGELAAELATSPRAVGQACRANPCPIFIPCHRVMGSNQRLVGFSGASHSHWLNLKAWLLAREISKS